MEAAEEIKKKIEASVKIMMALTEFDGKMAIETLTGVLISIVTVPANKGKEEEIMDSVIKTLKSGMKFMKHTKPITNAIDAIIGQLKKKQSARPGGNPGMN